MIEIIEINREPIELHKILKFHGLVASGGEAKMLIDEGLVLVNKQIEMRKRRKMLAGDQIEFDGQTFELVLLESSWISIN